jgi:hypothetical protein
MTVHLTLPMPSTHLLMSRCAAKRSLETRMVAGQSSHPSKHPAKAACVSRGSPRGEHLDMRGFGFGVTDALSLARTHLVPSGPRPMLPAELRGLDLGLHPLNYELQARDTNCFNKLYVDASIISPQLPNCHKSDLVAWSVKREEASIIMDVMTLNICKTKKRKTTSWKR